MARVIFLPGGVYTLQQTVSGAGVFNGSALGYAIYNYSAGGAAFRVRFPQPGADGNGSVGARFKFQMDAPAGLVVAKTTATYDKGTRTLVVLLRKTASTITADAVEVVNAINCVGFGVDSPAFWAGNVTNATIAAALAPVDLAGGLDADVSLGYTQPRFTAPDGTSAGLFYFDQDRPWRLLSVGGTLSGVGAITFQLVNVDKALVPIAGQGTLIHTETLASPFRVASRDINIPVMPWQAIAVDAALQGSVWVQSAAISAFTP